MVEGGGRLNEPVALPPAVVLAWNIKACQSGSARQEQPETQLDLRGHARDQVQALG